MKISLNDYIKNPTLVAGTMTAQQRKLIENDYKARFDKLLLKSGGDFAYFMFKDTTMANRYYIHIMIPSESIDKAFYDVAFELTLTNPEQMITDMGAYNIRFFSNDPAFMFTWAYVFNSKGLVIDWLKPKIAKKALTEKPRIRNPSMQSGYVKTFFFAYYYMKIRHLLTEDAWKNADRLNRSNFLKSVMNSNDKLNDTQRLKTVQKELKEQEEKNKIKKATTKGYTNYQSERVKISPNVAYAKTASSLKKQGGISFAPKIRRIGRRRRK